MIKATVIAHSKTYAAPDLFTLELEYPRFIHGEVMTHRVFSRNAMSSRAIPVEKMIAQVRKDPAMPLKFMKNKPGMQATEDLTNEENTRAIGRWALAAESAAEHASAMVKLGVHKQFANRLLEPFQWMRTIVSATHWVNFFELRDHEDAQPEFRALAIEMRKAIEASAGVYRGLQDPALDEENWHLPYVTLDERRWVNPKILPKLSAARCARVSYLNHDGSQSTMEKDLALFDRLVGQRPLHASPLEHQALPVAKARSSSTANFEGWVQYRHMENLHNA